MSENSINSSSNEKALILSFLNPKRLILDSGGEVFSTETVSLKNSEFHHLGLFSREIFGSVSSFDRRRKIGHIHLNCAVPHPWFLKFKWIFAITDVYENVYRKKNTLKVDAYTKYPLMHEMVEDLILYSDYYYKKVLDIDLVTYYYESIKRKEYFVSRGMFKDTHSLLILNKKIEILLSCIVSGQHPSWMFLTVLPVLPPDLRPILQLSPGLYISSDLNHMYKKILRINEHFGELVLISKVKKNSHYNENRIVNQTALELKWAIYELLDGKTYSFFFKKYCKNYDDKRKVKSIAERLHGKEGRFRHDVLGKRVNYSGRTVISSGPRMRFNECGLPFELFYKIFRGFILYRLWKIRKYTLLKVKVKPTFLENHLLDNQFFNLLDQYFKQHPIILNRAPTLHKYNMQSFYPRITVGRSILLHPLVCSSFNADFDGDTMAVHFPMSLETQIETRFLMHSSFNILSNSSSNLMISPSQDIVFGIYYLTMSDMYLDHKPVFISIYSINEVLEGLSSGRFTLFNRVNFLGICLTVGQLLFGNIFLSVIPKKDKNFFLKSLRFLQKTVVKKRLSYLLSIYYYLIDLKSYSYLLDQVMSIGFYYTYRSGLSIHKNDVNIPSLKKLYIKRAKSKIKYEFLELDLDSTRKSSSRFIEIWIDCIDFLNKSIILDISKTPEFLKPSIYMLVASGARGSLLQVQQLAGMRGFMMKASGDLLKYPILSNFKEGLGPMEYYNSIHGSRKGVIDTSLKTATSGYLTRKLVYSSKDIFISDQDCSTSYGYICSIYNSKNRSDFYSKLLGRVLSKDVLNPLSGNLLIKKNTLLTNYHLGILSESSVGFVFIRSPILCESGYNTVCQYCYGSLNNTTDFVEIDTPVGLIAAQSIGEPGTQLTMRTFHQGGAFSRERGLNYILSDNVYKVFYISEKSVLSDKYSYCLTQSMKIAFFTIKSNFEVDYSPSQVLEIPFGAKLFVSDGDVIKKNSIICWWNSSRIPIISPLSGNISIETHSFENNLDSYQILKISSNKNQIKYFCLNDDELCVHDNDYIAEGSILMYIKRVNSDHLDITGGLMKISKYFEIIENRSGLPVPFDSFFNIHSDSNLLPGAVNRLFCSLDPLFHSKKFSQIIELFSKESSRFLSRGNDYFESGDHLISGSMSIKHTIQYLGFFGIRRYIEHILNTYSTNGVFLKEVHFEIIVKSMLLKRKMVSNPKLSLCSDDKSKSSYFLDFITLHSSFVAAGITSSGLLSSSFFSAASFQRMSVTLSKATIQNGFEVLSESIQAGLFMGIIVPVGTGNKLLK